MAFKQDDFLAALDAMSVMDLTTWSRPSKKNSAFPLRRWLLRLLVVAVPLLLPLKKTEFDVVLKTGANKVGVIKAVPAKSPVWAPRKERPVDGAPKTVKEAMPKADAEAAKKKLEDAGAKA